MSKPTIHQRWDAKPEHTIGTPIDGALLIARNPCRRTEKCYISPSAPTTTGLPSPWQHTHLTHPSFCDDCDRYLHADAALSSRAGVAEPLAFSLSDACPEIGGAHGYVDLLKRVTVPPHDWFALDEALDRAGVPARDIPVRDRILAYVLWHAIMAPPGHRGLGFAPGVVGRQGGGLLFLDMLDPNHGIVEVHFFDFVRVLQEKVAARLEFELQRAERRQIEETVRNIKEKGKAEDERQEKKAKARTSQETQGSQFGGTQQQSRSISASPSTSSASSTDVFTPPCDPPSYRAHWCHEPGLRHSTKYAVPTPAISWDVLLAALVDPSSPGKGKSRVAPDDDWVFVAHPDTEWVEADEPPFCLDSVYKFVRRYEGEEEDEKEKKARRTWAQRVRAKYWERVKSGWLARRGRDGERGGDGNGKHRPLVKGCGGKGKKHGLVRSVAGVLGFWPSVGAQ